MLVQTRYRNTTTRGTSFTEATIETVWRKGRIVAGKEPAVFRKDTCGGSMPRSAYGQTSKYGWEIDHIIPVAQGGTGDLGNLQPLHWENNRFKGRNGTGFEIVAGARRYRAAKAADGYAARIRIDDPKGGTKLRVSLIWKSETRSWRVRLGDDLAATTDSGNWILFLACEQASRNVLFDKNRQRAEYRPSSP